MELYLFSGFLGSGKTTTIIALSKYLMEQGKKVGVVTNDQGKYLVDTAFMHANNIPAVDVQSGCFCSNYQDLVKQLDELKNKIDPDIVFAESIGSAGNLVGTVISPLLNDSTYQPKALVSMVDARLLLRIINDEYLPFSDSVNATFMNQLIESDMLIINKIDLLNPNDTDVLLHAVPRRFGDKIFSFQSAFIHHDIKKTYANIEALESNVKEDILFDAHLHQKALDRLEWGENVFELKSDGNVKDDIIKLIDGLLTDHKDNAHLIAHIKILIESPYDIIKLSITSLDTDDWRHSLKDFSSNTAKVIINSRVQK